MIDYRVTFRIQEILPEMHPRTHLPVKLQDMDKNKKVYVILLDRHQEGCDVYEAALKIPPKTNLVSAVEGAERNNSEVELGPAFRRKKHTKISSRGVREHSSTVPQLSLKCLGNVFSHPENVFNTVILYPVLLSLHLSPSLSFFVSHFAFLLLLK